ncbi:MAG: hypothetical protein HYR56_11990 [Acidobacteria bacterium]|nr:hypothetical protein [Acidobacteriota bacterium]MBI3422912.1 hypothetical protein [Acidobacteriota bacterium]
MSAISLLEPILNDSQPAVNFFNGRLLAAEDLTEERRAGRAKLSGYGRAFGTGVAYGLEIALPPTSITNVTATQPVNANTARIAQTGTSAPQLTVTPGLALNRKGELLQLNQPITLSLVPPAQPLAPPTGQALFSECLPFQAGVYVTGQGLYVLGIAPAEGRRGRAPVSSLSARSADCNVDQLLEGVQFKLHQLLDVTASELNDAPRLRNLVAAKCFGFGTNFFAASPFEPQDNRYGFETLALSPALTECEVPLAVLHWTQNRIAFVDQWAVRRRVLRPAHSREGRLLSDRRVGEGEARLWQFTEELETLRGAGTTPEAIRANQHFHFLPPAGVLPLTGRGRGFNAQVFFSGQVAAQPLIIEGARLEHLLRLSFAYPPIALGSGELIRLYQVRENRQAGGVAPYLAFAGGDLPFFGAARFDVSRWDFSNYTALNETL